MAEDYIDRVYGTLWGMLDGAYAVEGVESAFETGSYCFNKYDEVFKANINICKKLGVQEDRDVERIIDNLIDIQQFMCHRMYELGAQMGMKDIWYL